jgi:hypothetical protein
MSLRFLNNISIKCDLSPSITLRDATIDLIELADRNVCWVEADFNGFRIFVNGASCVDNIEAEYAAFLEKAND